MSTNLLEFTPEQKKAAQKKLLYLWLKRRFFLYAPFDLNCGYPRHLILFNPLREISKKYRTMLEMVQQVGEAAIRQTESDLGLVPPELKENQRILDCNVFTGGMDICTAWPVANFAEYVPANYAELLTQVDEELGRRSSSLSSSSEVATKIWNQLEELEIWDPVNLRTVIILKTRFEVTPRVGEDLLKGTVSDLQDYPEALGYLLYRASLVQHLLRKIPDPWILCSTNCESSVALFLPTNDNPRIHFNYDSKLSFHKKVHFATVM